ncbi:hypothetical protein ACIGHB_03890 [Streptomyces sp. NPDC085460]|uniref:hypothetical protein n=1 Tax=Streptomyces sp. NPDC085460 TaxID=3365723 RepID=UPI0037CD210A
MRLMSTVLAPRVLRRLLPASGAVAAVVALAAGCQADSEGPRDVALRFTVTDPAEGGRVVYDRSTRVELRVFHPNGEGCGPAVRQGGARADPVRGLVTRD